MCNFLILSIVSCHDSFLHDEMAVWERISFLFFSYLLALLYSEGVGGKFSFVFVSSSFFFPLCLFAIGIALIIDVFMSPNNCIKLQTISPPISCILANGKFSSIQEVEEVLLISIYAKPNPGQSTNKVRQTP